MKKSILSLVASIVTPMMLQAGGVGVYIPYSLGIKSTGTIHTSDEFINPSISTDDTLKNKSGIGIALATNLGKDSVFGYKVGFEYTNPEADVAGAVAADKYALIQTLEFGVVNTDVVKVWLGPRFDIGYETLDDGRGFSRSGMEFGIAPAVGINVNIGDSVAIAFDIDYNFAWQGGSVTHTNFDAYDASITGPTARLGVFYRWGEDDLY